MKERLKEIRKKLNLKQREMAEQLGITVGLIGQWESGVAPIPNARIYQICNEYNVRREWLENGSGDMFQSVDEQVAELLPKVSDRVIYREAFRRTVEKLKPELQERVLRFLRELLDYQEGRKPSPPPEFEILKNLFKQD